MKPILGHTKPASPGEGSQSLRIGDVASLVGTTPRTIRYYEEIGLLPAARSRPSGRHRVYTEADVERLREVMRLKDLLGLSLEELRMLPASQRGAGTPRPPAGAGAPPDGRARAPGKRAERDAQARPAQDPRA